MLTNNLRTKLVILTDDREISITEQQYNAIKADQAIGKYNDPILIRDADSKEILFDWKIGAIKEFRDINKSNLAWAYYVCDFWIKHPVHENCTDIEKYKVSPIVFRTALRSIYPQVQYSREITPEMRTKVLYSLNP